MLTPEQAQDVFDAVNVQAAARVRAFVDYPFPYEALDFRLRALTLRDIATLQFAGCGFFCANNAPVATSDALAVLWYLSDAYAPSVRAQKRFAKRLVRKFGETEIISAARAFIDEMLLDSGSWTLRGADTEKPDAKKPRPPHYSETAVLVARLAAAYHWSETEILRLPLPRVWQYYHLAVAAKDAEYNWEQYSEFLYRKYLFLNRKNNG